MTVNQHRYKAVHRRRGLVCMGAWVQVQCANGRAVRAQQSVRGVLWKFLWNKVALHVQLLTDQQAADRQECVSSMTRHNL